VGAGKPDVELSGGAYLRLVLLGAAIGIPAALVAAGFLALVHWLEDRLWTDLPDRLGYASPPWFLVVGLPVVGAAVVVLARTLLPGDGGHTPLAGIGGGVTRLRHAPGIVLAALGSLAFGAVLGPEAPLIALGSAVGVAVTLFVRLGAGSREERVLATAGSFSAISALFGGPLVAGMLLLEGGVGLGAAAIPALLPGLVAAGVGYTIFVGLGDWGGLEAATITVPGLPVYDGTHVADLLVAVAAGVVAAIVVAAVRLLALRIDERGRSVPLPALLLGGGLAVGLAAQLADVLGADSQQVLFSGQTAIPDLVAEGSAGIVLLLVAAKGFAYAVSLGCGFRGGPVFPAIFLGVGLAMLAVIFLDVSPTLAVGVGTAAGTAATTRLLFSSALFGTLLVGTASIDAVPAIVLATAAAWITAAALERRREVPPVVATAH
jgi:H+/Cl- antiporter ClcA